MYPSRTYKVFELQLKKDYTVYMYNSYCMKLIKNRLKMHHKDYFSLIYLIAVDMTVIISLVLTSSKPDTYFIPQYTGVTSSNIFEILGTKSLCIPLFQPFS